MEMLYRLSYVGAHDRLHPSGQHGSDAERRVVYWPMWEGSTSPDVCGKDTPPQGRPSLAKVVWGVARNGESSHRRLRRQPQTRDIYLIYGDGPGAVTRTDPAG